MAFRRRVVPYRRRKRGRFQWARTTFNNVGPVHAPNANIDDLLATFKTAAGITLNLPDIVIWRVHLKVTITFTLSPAAIAANSGVNFAMACENLGFSVQPVTAQYEERWLMWDFITANENQFMATAGTAGTQVLYKEYDIKAHRKLGNMNESLLTFITEQGNCVMNGYSITASVLLKLP